jgi:hypothetical protein
MLRRRAFHRSYPTEQEEMMAAKEAPVREQNPVERLFESVADTDAPELDRFAMRTSHGEHLLGSPRYTSVFAALPVPGALPPRKD